MKAEFIMGSEGPYIRLDFENGAERCAWKWLRSQSKELNRLTIVNEGGSNERLTATIGGWPIEEKIQPSWQNHPDNLVACPNGYRSHVQMNGICTVCGKPSVKPEKR